MKNGEVRDVDLLNRLRDFENIASSAGLPPELIKQVRKEVIDRIGQDESVIEKRLAGLEVEDEFMLMAVMLGNVEQITPLEQKQFVNWEKYGVPDFLLSVIVPQQFTEDKKPKVQRCFVEVKKAKEEKTDFVLPVETLTKLQMFSKLYTLPLYFAIKMNAYGLSQWFLLSDYSVTKLGKQIRDKIRREEEDCISVPMLEMPKEDFSGLWLSNYYVLVPQGFTICEKYREEGNSIVTRDTYGYLSEETLSNGKQQMSIPLSRGTPTENLVLHAVVEYLHVGKRRIEKVEGGTNVVYEAT